MAGKPSGKVFDTMVTLQEGVSGEGKWSGMDCQMAKMPPHPASEQDTGQEELWQTVCSLNCSLQEGDPRLLKPKLRQSFTATAPYCNTANPL